MARRPRGRDFLWLVLASGLVLVSRLPFLTPGYGADPDAWRTASAVRLIAETGRYHESHSPGHPVQEWVGSLLWQTGPQGLNGATAVASALSALFFGLACLELGAGAWSALAALALAFAPIVYIHSVDAMDYVWALCFSMAALWLALSGRWVFAGIALGLAIGSRITAGLLLIPLLLLGANERKTWGGVGAFVILSLGIGAAMYVPNFLQHGMQIFALTPAPYPPLSRLLQDTTLELWGTIGGLGVAVAIVASLLGRPVVGVLKSHREWIACAVLSILLYLVAFLRLPDEPAYLIPVVPFVVLVLARLARPALFAAACACILVSPYFLDLGRPDGAPARSGEIPLPGGQPLVILRPSEGALFVDRRQRKTGMRNGIGIVTAIRNLKAPAAVVVASWLPQVEVMSHDTRPEGVRLVEYVRAGEADSLLRRGTTVYYVPGTEAGSLYYEHVDLASIGARPLPYEPTP
ncbi:MAG TPA: hypothetical protein VGR66_11620 [Candidatus Eisenbacteria bacterium]|nr:hypothetical protein [Candidatus Eisenbacteria bacterium]